MSNSRWCFCVVRGPVHAISRIIYTIMYPCMWNKSPVWQLLMKVKRQTGHLVDWLKSHGQPPFNHSFLNYNSEKTFIAERSEMPAFHNHQSGRIEIWGHPRDLWAFRQKNACTGWKNWDSKKGSSSNAAQIPNKHWELMTTMHDSPSPPPFRGNHLRCHDLYRALTQFAAFADWHGWVVR